MGLMAEGLAVDQMMVAICGISQRSLAGGMAARFGYGGLVGSLAVGGTSEMYCHLREVVI